MAKPQSEVRADVKQAVDSYLDQLICDSTATGRGIACERSLLRPSSQHRRPIESRAARIPDCMNCDGCKPAGYKRPTSADHRHHWIEFQPNGSPPPPEYACDDHVPLSGPQRQQPCPPRYHPRDSMLAPTVKPVCPEVTVRSDRCYTPSDYAWCDVPNPYLQPNTGIYQAPANTTYKRDYFGPDKGNADYLPALQAWCDNASEHERDAAAGMLNPRRLPFARCREPILCPTRPLGATRTRIPGMYKSPYQPSAGVVTGLPDWACCDPVVKLQQKRMLEAVQNAQLSRDIQPYDHLLPYCDDQPHGYAQPYINAQRCGDACIPGYDACMSGYVPAQRHGDVCISGFVPDRSRISRPGCALLGFRPRMAENSESGSEVIGKTNHVHPSFIIHPD